MIAPTHAIYGPAIALIILAVFGVEASFHWTVITCAIIGSIAPDIDTPTSTIGRLVPWISKPIEARFGHRTLTHSLIGTLVASLTFTLLLTILITVLRMTLPETPTFLLTGSDWFIPLTLASIVRMSTAFAIGYTSHLALDMLTPRGVQLFWPRQNRDVIFKHSFQIETASKGEIPVFLVGLVLLASAFPLSQYGPLTAFRWFLATPEAAIAEFKASTTQTDVEFDGYWTSTKTPIHGTAEVLDVHNKRLVIAFTPKASPSAPPASATRSRSGSSFQASVTAEPSLNPSPVSTLHHRPTRSPFPTPTRSRVVVTLSDELSSDIAAKKCHLIKKNVPIKIDKYSFVDQTRETLLKRLPDEALISGVVYLPKELKIDSDHLNSNSGSGAPHQGIQEEKTSPQSNRRWVAIEQSGNELRLHFATKSELESIQFDKAFMESKHKNELKLKRLILKQRQLELKL